MRRTNVRRFDYKNTVRTLQYGLKLWMMLYDLSGDYDKKEKKRVRYSFITLQDISKVRNSLFMYSLDELFLMRMVLGMPIQVDSLFSAFRVLWRKLSKSSVWVITFLSGLFASEIKEQLPELNYKNIYGLFWVVFLVNFVYREYRAVDKCKIIDELLIDLIDEVIKTKKGDLD